MTSPVTHIKDNANDALNNAFDLIESHFDVRIDALTKENDNLQDEIERLHNRNSFLQTQLTQAQAELNKKPTTIKVA